jgi:hypothetical protein
LRDGLDETLTVLRLDVSPTNAALDQHHRVDDLGLPRAPKFHGTRDILCAAGEMNISASKKGKIDT